MSAVACAAVLLTAACGSSKSDSAADDAPPSTPRDQLVLSDTEFPAGVTKMDLPQDKIQASLADANSYMKNATLTPEECRGAQVDLAAASKDMLAKSSMVAGATNDMNVYVDIVSSQVLDLKPMIDNYAKCAEVSTTADIEGDTIDTKVKTEKLKVPAALSGTDAVAYRSTATNIISGGAPSTRTSYQGWATLRGTTVGVKVSAISGTPDEATFDKFFTDAVQKVKNAK
ncbi:hypothetical protein AB0N05_14875 [Nocardia sp. NPDC051030]|uniref:hypothetical protein n=1 Tax=Nocardia sp. NPDC051030 TaxID=3155162 RepID=UPI0034410438